MMPVTIMHDMLYSRDGLLLILLILINLHCFCNAKAKK